LVLIWLNKAVKFLSILINTLWTHRCSSFTKDLQVYKQLEVKTNQPSFVCGNHNTEHKASRHIIGEHKALKRWATRILMTGKSFVKALHLWVQSVFINIDISMDCPFCATTSVFSIVYWHKHIKCKVNVILFVLYHNCGLRSIQ
jgi:hypothetical protein